MLPVYGSQGLVREEDWVGQAGSYRQVFLVWKKRDPGLCEWGVAEERGSLPLHSGDYAYQLVVRQHVDPGLVCLQLQKMLLRSQLVTYRALQEVLANESVWEFCCCLWEIQQENLSLICVQKRQGGQINLTEEKPIRADGGKKFFWE